MNIVCMLFIFSGEYIYMTLCECHLHGFAIKYANAEWEYKIYECLYEIEITNFLSQLR